MNRILHWLFEDDESLRRQVIVAAGLVAYGVGIFLPVMGTGTRFVFLPIMMIAMGLACYAVLRRLLPIMDPREADTDHFTVWGSVVLFLLIGFASFGVWFAPGLVLGMLLIWVRVPELLEVFPGFDDKTDVR